MDARSNANLGSNHIELFHREVSKKLSAMYLQLAAHLFANAPPWLNCLDSESSSFALVAVHYGGPANLT